MEISSQGTFWHESFMAQGPFSTENVCIYQSNIMEISYNIFSSYIQDIPFPDLPPLAIQVPYQSSINSGSIQSSFEAEK